MATSNIFSSIFSKSKIAAKVGGLIPAVFLRKTDGTIADPTTNRSNQDLTAIRSLATIKEMVKALIANSPDASMSVSSLTRFAITDSYTVTAYDLNGVINAQGTQTAQLLANRLDNLRPDYKGFHLANDFRSLSERAILQLQINGSVGAELVLGQGRVPERINIIPTRTFKYDEIGGAPVPYITVDGDKYYLDSPLISLVDLDQDVETPYSASPLTSAVQPLLADVEFFNDLRRAFSKANLPRVAAKIITEQFVAGLTPEVRFDPKRLAEEMTRAIDGVKEQLNGLNPEDCIVHFDFIDINHLSAGNNSSADATAEQKSLIDGKVASGLHTLPSILGRGVSSSAASTEAMLYLRTVEGYQEKLNQMYSSILTTGIRLLGVDCYVKFTYADPALRPKAELEAFNTVKQSRTLELLNYGFISDEEASLMLTGSLPSGDFKPLSGTGFYKADPNKEIENPYSNTSIGGGISDTQSGKNQKAKNQKPSSNRTSGK